MNLISQTLEKIELLDKELSKINLRPKIKFIQIAKFLINVSQICHTEHLQEKIA